MESKRVALKTLALAAAGVIAIEALARWGIGRWGLAPLTGTALARLIDIAWMALVVSGSPQGWARIGLGREGWLPGLGRGLVWSAGFGALAALGWALLHAAGIDPPRLLHQGPAARQANPASIFLVGGFIGPVAEEIYFRGLIFGYLWRWGFWPALTGRPSERAGSTGTPERVSRDALVASADRRRGPGPGLYRLTIREAGMVGALRDAISRISDWKYELHTDTAPDGTLVGLITVEKDIAGKVRKTLADERVPELRFPPSFEDLTFREKIAYVQKRVAEISRDIRSETASIDRFAHRWGPLYSAVRQWIDDRLSLLRTTASAFVQPAGSRIHIQNVSLQILDDDCVR